MLRLAKTQAGLGASQRLVGSISQSQQHSLFLPDILSLYATRGAQSWSLAAVAKQMHKLVKILFGITFSVAGSLAVAHAFEHGSQCQRAGVGQGLLPLQQGIGEFPQHDYGCAPIGLAGTGQHGGSSAGGVFHQCLAQTVIWPVGEIAAVTDRGEHIRQSAVVAQCPGMGIFKAAGFKAFLKTMPEVIEKRSAGIERGADGCGTGFRGAALI